SLRSRRCRSCPWTSGACAALVWELPSRSYVENSLRPARGRPEDAENEEAPGALFLVADKKPRVAALPELLFELHSHLLLPVRAMSHMPPESECFPVDDRLSVSAARVRCALELILEAPGYDLELRLSRIGV